MSILPLIYLYSKLAANTTTPARYPNFNDFVKTLPAPKRTSLPVAPPEPYVDLAKANQQLRQRQRMAAMQRAQLMKAPPEPRVDLTEANRKLAAKLQARKTVPTAAPATRLPYDPKAPYISSKFARPKGYYTWKQVLRAMKQEESSNGKNLYGDKLNGVYRSFGPYQIQEAYAKDAGLNMRTWRKDVMNEKIAEKAILNYMKRYARKYIPDDPNALLSPAAIRAITRIHNGGPAALRATGDKLKMVTGYNNRVNTHLKNLFGE